MIERRAVLLEYIQSVGEAATSELFELFPDLTPKTIRRDLTFLEEAGAIFRSHGRARVNRQYLLQPEAYYSEREAMNSDIKNAIAASAAELIGDRRSIFIDAGTTMMALAHHLPDNRYTILTAAPNIALHVSAFKPSCSVMLTGGNLNPKTLSCSGYGSTEILKLLNIDIAFMAASAFSPTSGFSVGEHFECELKRAVVGRAQQVVMLMDSSKTGRNMPYTFARPQDIDLLVSDRGLDPASEHCIADKGVRILICDP